MEKKPNLKAALQRIVQKVKSASSKKRAEKASKKAALAAGRAEGVLQLRDCAATQGSMSLEQILEGYRKSGNPALATKIFEDHWHLVLGVSRRLLDQKDEAEDAAVDIFVKVLERLRLETPRNFAGWIYTVTRYHCFEIRRKYKKAPMLQPLDGLRHIVDDAEDYADVAERESAISGAVQRALKSLPAHQRTCIELFYFQERSYREISESEGYGIGEVKSYIQNGKRRLMGLLTPVRNQHVSDC